VAQAILTEIQAKGWVRAPVDPNPKTKAEPYVARFDVLSGSLYWGGCHLGHLEHRDGATFDIRLGAYSGAPVPQGWPSPSPGDLKKWRIKEPLFGVPKPGQLRTSTGPNSAKLKREPVFETEMKELVRGYLQPLRKGSIADPEKPFHGTPVYNQPEHYAWAVARHIALTLAGVDKWVFGCPLIHVRATTLLQRSAAAFGGQSDALLKQMEKAEFYFKPNDHFDHWHIVFRGGRFGASDRERQFAQLVKRWCTLGLDLTPLVRSLKARRYSASDPASMTIEADRQALIKQLDQRPSRCDGAVLEQVFAKFAKAGELDPPPDRWSREIERTVNRTKSRIGHFGEIEWLAPQSDVERSATTLVGPE
jgi:hypothetical protein